MFEIIVFTVILSFLVLIHELGHYLAALWAGVKVEEFGLGYPPRAITLFTYKGTPFTLNWVPFGGFVRMQGEDALQDEIEKNESSAKNTKKKATKTKPPSEDALYQKSAWKRLVIILAGVVVNFVFGAIAFAIVYSFQGIPTPINQARIAAVAPDSPAELAELPTGVNIIAVGVGEDRQAVSTNEEVIERVSALRGETVTLVTTGECRGLTCQESAQEFEAYVRTEAETPEAEGALGVAFAQEAFVHYPWYEQIVRGMVIGVIQAVLFGGFILVALGNVLVQLIGAGQVPADIAGPVGIVHQAQQQELFSAGPVMLLNFTGLLSVNLAIMNLLPIPALDGGRALFIMLEKVVGKRRVQLVEGYANYGGFLVLIGLILLITARDIWRIFA